MRAIPLLLTRINALIANQTRFFLEKFALRHQFAILSRSVKPLKIEDSDRPA